MIHGLGPALFSGVLGLVSPATGQDYFPQALRETPVSCAAFRGRTRPLMDDHKAHWYGSHLSAAGERPLSEAAVPTLRFTWLRTFHAPVVVRLETATDGAVTMTATELSGHGGYEPGTVARRVERRLSGEEVAALTRTLEDAAVLEQAPGECSLGMDGAQWIIESAGPDGYRFVERWTPREGPVRAVGLHLIGLTGWTYDSVY
jgi:hypothetical protein